MLAATPTQMTVADYCGAMERNEINVNLTYQRSDEVWPDVARSFLIESILLGYPISKVYLHSKTDLRTRTTVKDIIDGQQRSRAIRDFYRDEFALSSTIDTDELIGRRYSGLTDEWKARFLTYNISVDLFTAANPVEVIQIFRRMNSYTVPLNPEEQRHAEYQGPFKWFIYNLARENQQIFSGLGILSDKSLVRMQDMKLLTEVVHAMVNGVTTTSKTRLNSLYELYNEEFEQEQEFQAALEFSLSWLASLDYIAGTNLAKPYIIYSLLLAFLFERWEIPGLVGKDYDRDQVDDERLRAGLLHLSDALDREPAQIRQAGVRNFVKASRDKTNVKAQREIRTKHFLTVINAAI